jgi:hypothetical protein
VAWQCNPLENDLPVNNSSEKTEKIEGPFVCFQVQLEEKYNATSSAGHKAGTTILNKDRDTVPIHRSYIKILRKN